jgi:TetR/AcrR family transcriptional regulator, regulator of autoinduction and epiphytic fitness
MAEPVKPRRSYNSTRRREAAEQTRQRILDAARRRFIADGYAGTTIAAIAADAGTAAETVYATFRTKPALLEAVVRAAARGDTPTEILDQPGPQAAARADDPREQLQRFAADVVARLERVGPVLRVLGAAEAAEPALADLHARIQAARLENLRAVPAALARVGALAVAEDAAADTVWALASPDVHDLLTRQRGWTQERYVDWLATTLAAALLVAPDR